MTWSNGLRTGFLIEEGMQRVGGRILFSLEVCDQQSSAGICVRNLLLVIYKNELDINVVGWLVSLHQDCWGHRL